LAEVSVTERNLLGQGQFARAALQYGEYTRGVDLSYVEPYFLGYRLAGGIDLFYRDNLANNFVSYSTTTVGTNLRLGFALTEELSLQTRYSIYQQTIQLPSILNDCILSNNASINGGKGVNPLNESGQVPGQVDTNVPGGCYADGETSLPIRIALANGPTITSLVGYTLAYNTLDNNKSPTNGLYAEVKQDFAGVGGDVDFIRSTADVRTYTEVFPDVVGVLHLQGGHVTSWGGQQIRSLDEFQMGPNLVRGFAPSGFGPRDLTSPTADALGGSLYWGASAELQTPLYFLPKEVGVKLSTFADAGSLWDYKGPTSWAVTGETLTVGDTSAIRSSVGIGIVWDSPLGPLRFDFAEAITKQSYDHTQFFRFSGGTKF
jgi:outer membrane protein insertion porin family